MTAHPSRPDLIAALDEHIAHGGRGCPCIVPLRELRALRTALASEPEPQPVAWRFRDSVAQPWIYASAPKVSTPWRYFEPLFAASPHLAEEKKP